MAQPRQIRAQIRAGMLCCEARSNDLWTTPARDTVTPPPAAPRHPPGLYVLFFTEMWERFGFYTMIAIFTLYMKAPAADNGLGLSTTTAGDYYGYFMGLVYFTPLLGGLVADRLLGEYRSIVIGAVFLGAGYALLALPPGDGMTLFFAAMASIVVGNGLFKPNISTMLGRLYPRGSPLRDSGFSLFYTGINLGALFAPFAASWLRTSWSWQTAFGAAGAGMALSLAVFAPFRRIYTPPATDDEGGEAAAASAAEAAPVGTGTRLFALAVLYLVSTMFWALFFQNGFALTLWAKDCTARPDWLPPELFQAVNPICIVALSAGAALFWQALGKRGREPSTPDKILLGLLAAIGACLVMLGASLAGGDACAAEGLGERVSMLWLVATYVVISLAEILVSPMGLSYCTKVAPRGAGGLVMGGWFVSLALGGYVSGFMGSRFWVSLDHSTYFMILGAAIAAVSVLLLVVRDVLRRAAP